MPATEQTWRSTTLLHKIFAVSGVTMLLATIWLLAKDHAREWKSYQRTANQVELTLTDWRKIQYETNDAVAEHKQLANRLEVVRREAVDWSLIDEFIEQVAAVNVTEEYVDRAKAIKTAAEELTAVAGEPAAEAKRDRIISDMRDIVENLRITEDTRLGTLKFARANRDAAVAVLGLMVRDDKNQKEMAEQQAIVEVRLAEVDELQRAYDEAKTQRTELLAIIKKITVAEDDAQDALAKNQAGLAQLQTTEVSKRSTYFVWYGAIPLPGKRWLELPILDAFNSPRKIDNLWSDGLMIDYNFSKVRRFDRCTTCHQSIQKTNPGSAVDPAYPSEKLIDFVLLPPESSSDSADGGETTPVDMLGQYYGLRLASEGLLAANDVTVQYVRPESMASKATSIGQNQAVAETGAGIRQILLSSGQDDGTALTGLKLGDVIAQIDGDPMRDARKVMFRLLDAAESNQTLVLTIRRGLPNPYTSHPRLDLFVGSLSPHKTADFACTICHEGQGSATAFEWASHSPNTVIQTDEWTRELGWSDNPHWIYPMYPKRFAESSCLKCHHEVTDLNPSERFPDPPAPKVVHGYDLVRKYGCYGCHEINGYDGSKRIGPDLRLEPNYFAAALQLQAQAGFDSLPSEVKGWTTEIAEHPERDAVRHRLYEALQANAESDNPALSNMAQSTLVPLLKDVENAGTLRRPGPSLRFVKQKLDREFMFNWIREPKSFRPTTRMPQFFELWSHFPDGHDDLASAFEPVEILGIVTYLMQGSKDFEYLEPPAGMAEASIERGKILFEERGCLACHNHRDFPNTATYRGEDEIIQGPDLSGVGTKFDAERNPDGRKWLYSWIKQPTRYHARTVMPDLYLTPIKQADGTETDPVADIVAYLLESSKVDWQPAEGTLTSADGPAAKALDQLVFENLRDDAFPEESSKEFAKTGIPAHWRDELKGAEIELLTDTEGAVADGRLTADAKLRYVGRKAFAKYGCYGCHDVPGFEDAKPIGTALNDWGRKETSKLAFEHITQYLEHHGHAAHGDSESHGNGQHAEGDGETEEMRDYYHEQLEANHREGFIYQKLAEPRSYDYHKTENKKYYERLRMPKFPFTAQEREAVITFVLGLVADPPSAKYIYQPDPRQKALVEGRKVLDKYNCAGCHMLEPERWGIAHAPDAFAEQPASKAYPFLTTHFTPDQLEASQEIDTSGLLHSTVMGMPALEDLPNGVRPLIYDDFGDPIEDEDVYSLSALEYPFDLWQPTTIGGHGFEVGVLPLNVRAPQIEKKFSTRGGFLAKYLLQPVVQREKQVNPAAKGTEAWGWLPPPLIGEGAKVQTSWLHDFLLEPYRIRPATVLRMPRFNMSPEEATKLVNYFAANENVEYPYNSSKRQRADYLNALRAAYQQATGGTGTRLGDAMNIVTNNNYCVKCHLVGDFEPKGADRAKAPNLAVVYNRLRPDYLRNWIANPKTILPYTSMPVNVPYDPNAEHLGGVSQDLYHGTSVEQVDALVDLLLNFDKYAEQRSSVAELITGEAPAVAAVVPSPVARPTEPAPAPTPTPKPDPMPKPAEPSPAPKPAPVASAKPLPDSLKNLPKASGWGDVKVQFVYDGTAPSPSPVNVTKDQEYCGKFGLVDESFVVNPENGGIKNIVASLSRGRDTSPMPIHDSYLEHARDNVVLDNIKCRFEPHVTLLWTPQTLVVKNSDPVGHNTKIETLANPAINDIVPAGASVEKLFPQAERRAASVACSIHPWMTGWLVVRDDPYAAVSDKDGRVEIKNLPEGEWTIQFWQEEAGYVANVKVDGKKTEWKRGSVDVKIENGKVVDLGVVQFAP